MIFENRQKKLPGWMSQSYLHAGSKRRRWKGKNPNNPFKGNSRRLRNNHPPKKELQMRVIPTQVLSDEELLKRGKRYTPRRE